MARPESNEHPPEFSRYISLLPDGNIVDALRAQIDELAEVAARVPPDRETFAYAPDKWSVRQVFGHLCDGERVFSYRALCISRGETASLPGFDENVYVARAMSPSRRLSDLAEELTLVRRANVHMFESLDPTAWAQMGNANGSLISVNAIAWGMAGHTRHHLNVLRDRYGIA